MVHVFLNLQGGGLLAGNYAVATPLGLGREGLYNLLRAGRRGGKKKIMSGDVERFERWSKTYEDYWGQRYHDRLYKLMLELTAATAPELNPSVILDVGCGTGRLLRAAAALWPAAQLIGIDPAKGMLEVAQKLTPTARFHQAFAESLPLDDASVGLVLSAVSMHHWSDASLGAREVARVLQGRGFFCLGDIAPPAWLSKLFRSKAKSRRATRDLLAQSGFQIGRQQTIFAGLGLVSVAIKNATQ